MSKLLDEIKPHLRVCADKFNDSADERRRLWAEINALPDELLQDCFDHFSSEYKTQEQLFAIELKATVKKLGQSDDARKAYVAGLAQAHSMFGPDNTVKKWMMKIK